MLPNWMRQHSCSNQNWKEKKGTLGSKELGTKGACSRHNVRGPSCRINSNDQNKKSWSLCEGGGMILLIGATYQAKENEVSQEARP